MTDNKTSKCHVQAAQSANCALRALVSELHKVWVACRNHKENVPDYRFSQAMAEGPQSPLRQSLFRQAGMCMSYVAAASFKQTGTPLVVSLHRTTLLLSQKPLSFSCLLPQPQLQVLSCSGKSSSLTYGRCLHAQERNSYHRQHNI